MKGPLKEELWLFEKYLVSEGWDIDRKKADYQMLRAKKGKRFLVIFERTSKSTRFFTLQHTDADVFEAYKLWKKNGGYGGYGKLKEKTELEKQSTSPVNIYSSKPYTQSKSDIDTIEYGVLDISGELSPIPS